MEICIESFHALEKREMNRHFESENESKAIAPKRKIINTTSGSVETFMKLRGISLTNPNKRVAIAKAEAPISAKDQNVQSATNVNILMLDFDFFTDLSNKYEFQKSNYPILVNSVCISQFRSVSKALEPYFDHTIECDEDSLGAKNLGFIGLNSSSCAV